MEIAESLQRVLGDAVIIERELGGGGMARIFLATEHALNRKIVIKALPGECGGAISVDRFRREIALAASLQHPHIVPILQAGDADGVPYYTMPYVAGESLRARLEAGPLPTAEVIACVRDVARALAYAHEHGVVHRDIKPDNILRSGDACAITDFGIAKALSAVRDGASTDGAILTQAGTSIGTPAYMAPEQAAADPAIDHRADLYALGCVTYELLTGRPPFLGASYQKLLTAHLFEAPQPVDALRPEVPPALADLVMRCLAKDAEDRPSQAAELLRVLDATTTGAMAGPPPARLSAEAAATAGQPAALPPAAAPNRPRQALRLAGGLLLAVAAVYGARALRERASTGAQTAPPPTASDRVLVVDIPSPGADSTLGPVVTEVIRTALAQARPVTVLQQDHLIDALQRMQRPITTPVDLPLAREIAQREGVKVIVDGKLLAIGGQYVLSLRMIAHRTGEALATFRESAKSEAEIVPAIDRITKGVRTALGESLRHIQASPPLEQVTTPSLEALRKYVEAGPALVADTERGLRLLHEATVIDTGFAMAYRKLAVMYRNLEFSAEAERNMERAFTFRSRLGEVERLQVEGAYYRISEQADTAASRHAYEQLLDIQPDNQAALNNLALQYLELRRFVDAEVLLRRAVALDPHANIQYTNLLEAVAETKGPTEVRRVAAAFRRSMPETPERLATEALVAWAIGEVDSAQFHFAALRQRPLNRFDGPWILRHSAHIEGARGRLRESAQLHRQAATWSEREGQSETVLGAEALAAYLQVLWRPDTAQALRQLDAAFRRTSPRLIEARYGAVLPAVVRAYAAGGRVARARALLARWDSLQAPLRVRDDAARFGMVAEIAEAEGKWPEALAAWRASDIGKCTFCAAPGLARVYERMGQRDAAIAAFERFLAVPHYLARPEQDAMHRADAHRRLATLYEAAGANEKAIAQYEAFARLWQDADAELQPQVAEARTAIRRLAAGRPDGRR
jgi:tetratricopeptide (TPR) repeat protein